jgi:hypothetical protein
MNDKIKATDVVFRARLAAVSNSLRRQGKSYMDPKAVIAELVFTRCASVQVDKTGDLKSMSIEEVYAHLGDAPFFMKRHFEKIPTVTNEHIRVVLEIWNELKKMSPHWISGVDLILRSQHDTVALNNTLNAKDVVSASFKTKPTWRAW